MAMKQTDTAAFRRWFGDSKVVDESGEPLVVYHGTASDFLAFSADRLGEATDAGTLGSGFYFTTSIDAAQSYAEAAAEKNGSSPRVIEAYLRIENPYPAPRRIWQLSHDPKGSKKHSASLRRQGYDGVFFHIDQSVLNAPSFDEFVVFSPTQIKSATDNEGTFDPTNPDVRKNPSRRALPNRKLTQTEIDKLGQAYLKGQDISGTRRAAEMARAQAERVHREFDKLSRKIRIEFTEIDPYKSFEELQQDVLVNKRMYVYTLHSETPLWDERTNIMARAVHDFDHVAATTDFSVEGEIATYQYSADRASELDPLYLSEIALQAASSLILGGFESGAQRFVLPEHDVVKLAQTFRRNPEEHLTKSEALAVWDFGGALKFMSPEQMMTRLAEQGVPYEDALILVLAAEMSTR